jgi:hypothetical protein
MVLESNDYFDSLFKVNDFIKSAKEESGFNMVEGIVDSYSSTNDKLLAITRLKNEVLSFVVNNMNRLSIDAEKDSLLKGGNSFANRIRSIKNSTTHPLNKNYLIANLEPIIGLEKGDELHLRDVNNTSTIRANKFYDAFLEIYDADYTLAVNFVKQSLLQSGFNNSKTTLHNLIPAEILLEVVKSMYNTKPDYSKMELGIVTNNANQKLFFGNLFSDNGKLKISDGYTFSKNKDGDVSFLISGKISTVSKEDFRRSSDIKNYKTTAKNFKPVEVKPQETTLVQRIEKLNIKECN